MKTKKNKKMELQLLIAAKTIAAEFVQWVLVDRVLYRYCVCGLVLAIARNPEWKVVYLEQLY